MTPSRALIEAAENCLEMESDCGGECTSTETCWWNQLKAAISSAKAAEEGIEDVAANKAPQHAFEISIRIGANEAGYVARALQEISETIDRSGVAGGCSGGWQGSWSIDVRKRDVMPDDYRNELEEWRLNRELPTVIEVREKEGL